MRVAVLGAGGVGGYVGARLAEAGCDVVLIARGDHGRVIAEKGLDLRSPAGNAHVRVEVAKDPASARPFDVVILGVKAFQVGEACSALKGCLEGDGFVLTLQNGVEAAAEAGEEIGRKSVVPGVCRISSFIEAPGVIRHASIDPSIQMGEADGRPSARVDALLAVLHRAKDLASSVRTPIATAIWEKFLFIAPASGVTAATRRPMGDVRENPESRELLLAALRETVELGRAEGAALPEDAVARTMAAFDAVPGSAVPSMARDIDLGRPSELDYQTGAVVRLARKRGIPAPVNEFLYACLVPSERVARKAAAQGA
jgi:2-dehydropantoate 2-reductase